MGGPRPVGAQRRRVRDRADPLGRPSPPPRPHIHTRDSNEAYMPQNSLIYLISIQSNRPGIYPTYRHQKAHYPERDYTDGTTTYKNLECWSRTSRATEANYSEIMCVGTVEFFSARRLQLVASASSNGKPGHPRSRQQRRLQPPSTSPYPS